MHDVLLVAVLHGGYQLSGHASGLVLAQAALVVQVTVHVHSAHKFHYQEQSLLHFNDLK